jgi:hypothetical protein
MWNILVYDKTYKHGDENVKVICYQTSCVEIATELHSYKYIYIYIFFFNLCVCMKIFEKKVGFVSTFHNLQLNHNQVLLKTLQ